MRRVKSRHRRLSTSFVGRIMISWGMNKKRNLFVVVSVLILVLGGILLIAIKLAMRDAENAVDFFFKVLGASAALVFSIFGPIGFIGLLAFFGANPQGGRAIGPRLAFGALVSIALTIYVLNNLHAYSLFF